MLAIRYSHSMILAGARTPFTGVGLCGPSFSWLPLANFAAHALSQPLVRRRRNAAAFRFCFKGQPAVKQAGAALTPFALYGTAARRWAGNLLSTDQERDNCALRYLAARRHSGRHIRSCRGCIIFYVATALAKTESPVCCPVSYYGWRM